MRGRFTADTTEDEWCERRLLSRIHRYTIKRLRAEIEPVSARDFLRFLLAWQRVAPEARMAGPKALDTVLAQLEGFEAPAAAWDAEILPARLADYDPAWLDQQCRAGHLTWMRLRSRNGTGGDRRPSPLRTTPIAILPRRQSGLWTALSPQPDGAALSPRAQTVMECIRQNGASFFHDLLEDSGLLRSQLEEAIAELVAFGLVTCDSFAGLRALLIPSAERRTHNRRRRRTAQFGVEDAGRWSLVRRTTAHPDAEAIEHVARALLRRYGVVFWRLIEREAAWLPPWRELLRVYRRLESRGEIRGGRFVAGFCRRAVRAARRDRHAARNATATGRRYLGRSVRLGPAQPCRHSHAGAADCLAHRQPRALPRRPADGVALRRRSDLLHRARAGDRMAGASSLAAGAGAGTVACAEARCRER